MKLEDIKNLKLDDDDSQKIEIIEENGKRYFIKSWSKKIKKILIKKVPACFEDQETWEEWLLYAIKSKLKLNKYCTDCTVDFRAKMKKENKCKSRSVRDLMEVTK